MRLSRADFARAEESLQREWLVTNGLGGFGSGTISLANTRRYHGLLVAALRPPVDRILMVAKLDASVEYQGRRFDLACNEFSDGTLAPRGFELLSEFRLEDGIPAWMYAIADARLTQRIWMEHGQNTTCVSFTLEHATRPIHLQLVPLCTYRDYHSHSRGGWAPEVDAFERGFNVTAFQGARSYGLTVDQGRFEPRPDWYWNFRHRAEAERGLDATEDLFRPGMVHAEVAPGETVTCVASAEPMRPERGTTRLNREKRRRQRLLQSAPGNEQWICDLTLAADQFIVRRGSVSDPESARGATIIAGYPWFGDWGRDTMIAVTGLTLTTGRARDAAAILRTFAEHTSQGMLPNRFPDSGEAPEYNTADATLWYFHAIDGYLSATDDTALLRDLYPTLKEIICWHLEGTRYGIRVDERDGLLHVGEPGVQLTWMDAKIGEWVVTPRTGKPVEINALWHFALVSMARWARLIGDVPGESEFTRAASRVAASFARAFWYEAGGYLYDVIDVPGPQSGNGRLEADASLRPNQIFAVSLGTDLLDARQSRAVVDTCARELLTPVGLRSLAAADSRYAGQYRGGPSERDSVYHQGTVWSWLLGAFVLAHYRVYRDTEYAIALLKGLAAHLEEACLGTISEIFDGDAPHAPRGCFAQAWSVAETLRAWHLLARERTRQTSVSRAAGAQT